MGAGRSISEGGAGPSTAPAGLPGAVRGGDEAVARRGGSDASEGAERGVGGSVKIKLKIY